MAGPASPGGVHLITYVDRLAGTLPGLAALLRGPLRAFTGVHLLPFFQPYDGVDAGFDPIDHLEVDPRLGSWDDVRAIAREAEVTADLIVNHISAGSAPYKDWLARGDASPSAGMFLRFGRVFPGGATEEELTRIYRPRPGLPFTPVVRRDGSRHLVWTTFDARQIDLDVGDPESRRYLHSVLSRLAGSGVSQVRLDAVGYAVKRRGTSCFMTAETLAFIDELTEAAHASGLRVLCELHGHHELQLALARHVDLVYDFGLPSLLLQAILTGDPRGLATWLALRPPNTVNVLDTHDGIGIIDVAREGERAGILGDEAVLELCERVHAMTHDASRSASRPVAWSAFPYQLNTTYYAALGEDDQRYLLARLVQLFLPGLSQIYYVGLLAGSNDLELVARSGVGRDINRHRYSAGELALALERPVVRAMLGLVRLRAGHPAFGGEHELRFEGESSLGLAWRAGEETAALAVDFRARSFKLSFTTPRGLQHACSTEELVALT